LSSSNRLPSRSGVIRLSPVIFPPGCRIKTTEMQFEIYSSCLFTLMENPNGAPQTKIQNGDACCLMPIP
jgi:hypothetical protein